MMRTVNVKVPENLVVIDFDLKDKDCKSGAGIHLHYYTYIHDFSVVKEHRKLNDIFEIEKIIKEYYNEASYGLFFNRNNFGDKMVNIYNKNGIQIDICYDYGYFEIFGLDSLQETELTKFYENLKNNIRK